MDYATRSKYVSYARVLADTAGLGIVFHEEEVQPHTDGRNLHVQSPSYSWTESKWKQWYYELLHEIGHQRKPWDGWKEVMKENKINHSNILGRLNNLNSDQAQEHDHYGSFRGIDMILGEGRSEFVKRVTEPHVPKDEEVAAWQACWHYDALCRETWNPHMVGATDKLPIHDDALPYLEKLVKWGESAADCTDEEEVYEFTKKQLDILGLDSEQLEQEMQEAAGQSGEGEAGEGEGEEGEGQAKWVKYDPYFQHSHEVGAGYADITIDYSEYKPDGGGMVCRDMNVVDFQTGENVTMLTSSRSFDVLKSSNGFSNKVRRLLQVLSAERYEGGKRTGKLNSRTLWRCKVRDPHIFKKKVEKINLKDTAVSLLVDFSGSMGGRKIEHAVASCLMLNDAIAKLQVPVEIAGFTDDGRPWHFLIKKFSERLTEGEIKDRMGRCASYMGGNSDGESVQYAYERLFFYRPEKRKVLIVMSDGQPASSQCGDDPAFLREVVKQIRDAGAVDLYGIGIKSDAVERYYPNRTVLKDAQELESTLLEVVKDQIITGG